MSERFHRISIIIPVFNENSVLPYLIEQLQTVIFEKTNPSHHWEVLLINDGSEPACAHLMNTLANQRQWLTIIHLSRNFGQQAAISAGLDFAQGDAVILMDADLQDPPDLIPKLIEQWQAGYDVVHAQRLQRHQETLYKRLSSFLFYRLLNTVSHTPIVMDSGEFKLLDRRVVNHLKQFKERHRFLRGLTNWVGFKQTIVTFDRPQRHAGQTKYKTKQMIMLAFDAITSFSTVPLHWITTFGFIISATSFLAILWVCYAHWILHATIHGWSSIMAAMLFLGGVQLISIGIIGEYIGRIYDEVRQRPLYLVDHIYNNINTSTTTTSHSLASMNSTNPI